MLHKKGTANGCPFLVELVAPKVLLYHGGTDVPPSPLAFTAAMLRIWQRSGRRLMAPLHRMDGCPFLVEIVAPMVPYYREKNYI